MTNPKRRTQTVIYEVIHFKLENRVVQVVDYEIFIKLKKSKWRMNIGSDETIYFNFRN